MKSILCCVHTCDTVVKNMNLESESSIITFSIKFWWVLNEKMCEKVFRQHYKHSKWLVRDWDYDNVLIYEGNEVCDDDCNQFSCLLVSDSLWPHGLQHSRLPWTPPTPGAYSNSCPSSRWCHPAISSSIVPFSSCLQSFPASGSFPVRKFFASGGQSIGVSASASVFPVNIQDWFPLGWNSWISLQSKGLSRVFSNITVQKHQFFSTELSL